MGVVEVIVCMGTVEVMLHRFNKMASKMATARAVV
jgi:hypothetical protein